jgi:hypothetical protein
MKAVVTTSYEPSGHIHQKEFCGPKINKSVVKHIVNVREKQIREALIRMGWKPPEELMPIQRP